MLQVMRCDSGKHELVLLKAQCPFCEIERLQSLIEDYQEAQRGGKTIERLTREVERRAEKLDCALAREIELRAALSISRGQWIHSVNAAQCLEALGEPVHDYVRNRAADETAGEQK